MPRLGPVPFLLALSACVATVPRPEALDREPMRPEDAQAQGTAGHAAPRAARERATRACLPKALAEHGRVTMAKLASVNVLAFCMRPEGTSDETPDACFEWSLDTQAFRIGKPLEAVPPPAEPPALPAKVKVSADAVSICDDQDKCAAFISAKLLPRTEQYRREADNRLLVRLSSDNKLAALVQQRAGTTDESQGEVEVWSVDTKKKLKRFKVTSQGHGDQISALRFLGSVLLVEQCDAGPACTGRLFDPTTGKQLREVPINFYGAELYPLEGGRWLFVDGWLQGAAVIDVPSARVVAELQSGVSGPAEDAGRVVRLDSGELLFILSGAGEGSNLAHGGMLVRLDVTTGATPQRFAPPGCPE